MKTLAEGNAVRSASSLIHHDERATRGRRRQAAEIMSLEAVGTAQRHDKPSLREYEALGSDGGPEVKC